MKQANRKSCMATRITAEARAAVRQPETMADAHIIRLLEADQQRFAELLLDPPPVSPALERARAAHDRLIRHDETVAPI